MLKSTDCPNCEENNEKVLTLEELINDDSAQRDELDVELEIAKVELKDLKKTLEAKLVLGDHAVCLEKAVTEFRRTVLQLGIEDEEDKGDDSKVDDPSSGERIVIRRKKKVEQKRKKTATYWHPEGIVLDDLDQALTDVAVLQGQVKQLKSLNNKLQEMYRDAEVKHAMAQFKISKLEKAKRVLQLEKAEVNSRAVLDKLHSDRKSRIALSPITPKSPNFEDLSNISENDAERGLLSAAQNGDLVTINILCERFGGSSEKKEKDSEGGQGVVNCRNRDGWTPLMLASARGHLPVVIKLLTVGGDPALTETDLGYTALHLAAWNNRPNVVKHLVEEANCSVDPEGENRRTPLMLAANWGATAALRVLIDLGANPNHTDTRGKTAIDWARDKSVKSTLQEAKQKYDQKKFEECQNDV